MPVIVPSTNSGKWHYNQVTWTEAEDEQLRLLFPTRKPSELEKRFEVTYEQIRTRARSLKLKSQKTIRRELLNQKFFEELNVTSSYWAGFLMADGSIRGNALWVGLAEKDKGHLEKFAAHLGVPDRVRSYQSIAGGVVAGKEYVRVVFEVKSAPLVEALHLNFNVLPQKTLQPYLPPKQVNGDYAKAFLAGVVDGDGFIGTYVDDQYIRFGFLGAKELCQWGASIVNEVLVNLDRVPTAKVRESRPRHWEMRCVGRNAQIVLNNLKSVCGHLVLARKWDVLEKFNQSKKWLVDKTAA